MSPRHPHFVVFQRESRTPDGGGGHSSEWNQIATAWGTIRPISGAEFLSAGKLKNVVSHKITLPYLDGITSNDRCIYEGRIFNIENAPAPVSRREDWLITVSEGGQV